jgi:hypothetical protein
MFGQDIRHDHDKKYYDVGGYAICSRSIFFLLFFSDMIEESSFQKVDGNSKKYSHEETADI